MHGLINQPATTAKDQKQGNPPTIARAELHGNNWYRVSSTNDNNFTPLESPAAGEAGAELIALPPLMIGKILHITNYKLQ